MTHSLWQPFEKSKIGLAEASARKAAYAMPHGVKKLLDSIAFPHGIPSRADLRPAFGAGVGGSEIRGREIRRGRYQRQDISCRIVGR
ncbi:hypothetical protein NHH82_01465 [Oxalobacteraceae bacterium OTU3REALA1]|nr:hypothetical protein NHH82_01465 [Oxalobacteraceae bacterium OTU3REALA1]